MLHILHVGWCGKCIQYFCLTHEDHDFLLISESFVHASKAGSGTEHLFCDNYIINPGVGPNSEYMGTSGSFVTVSVQQ